MPKVMPNQMLDALVLATLPLSAQVQRVAAYWRAQYPNRAPYSKTEADKWVQQEFGRLWSGRARNKLTVDLVDAIKSQLGVRRRRDRRALLLDPLTTPEGSTQRLGWLLLKRLGPARRWESPHRTTDGTAYIDGAVYSGLVCGLVPIRRRTRAVADPNLLVYRYLWEEPRNRYVPAYITSVDDAFEWLIPDECREFLRGVEGCRVEHDGDAQAVRLITPWGIKALPWRELTRFDES